MKILTYNTHLFVGTVPAAFKDLEYDDDIRINEIIKQIEIMSPDIVCLQEVWGNNSRSLFIEKCGAPFYYNYKPDDSGKSLSLSSGLLILSKHKIENGSFIAFENASGWDAQANKGFAIATIRSSSGEILAHLVNTHAQAGNNTTEAEVRKSQFVQICDAIYELENTYGWNNDPIFLCGDFNVIGEINGYVTNEYQYINKMLKGRGLTDAFRELNPLNASSPNYGYTVNTFSNKLAAHFNSSGNQETMRLDYFYVNSNVNPTSCDVQSYGWVFLSDCLMDDSDHYPVLIQTP